MPLLAPSPRVNLLWFCGDVVVVLVWGLVLVVMYMCGMLLLMLCCWEWW
jgi:hypothetical protein